MKGGINIKKTKGLVLITLMFCTMIVLLGCGYDTREWPHMSFDFTEEQLLEVTINYEEHTYGLSSNTFEDSLTISDRTTLKNIYNDCISFAYMPDSEDSINIREYHVKIKLTLSYYNDFNIKRYILTYYNYGYIKGYFVLDDGKIHYLPGNFSSVIFQYFENE